MASRIRREQDNQVAEETWRPVFGLEIFLYGNILPGMARAATTSDVFNAIAEPRRRQIVELLAASEARDVTELVIKLGLPQPGLEAPRRAEEGGGGRGSQGGAAPAVSAEPAGAQTRARLDSKLRAPLDHSSG